MSSTLLKRPRMTEPRLRMTFRQFLSTEFENEHVEWVSGEVVPMAPISSDHQYLGSFLLTLFRAFVEEKQLGVVQYEPFHMKTGPDLPSRAPDVMFISNARKKRIKKNYLDGPADLVVEIVSPRSRKVDRADKFAEYEQGGITEYWLIDPSRNKADFFQLSKQKNFIAAIVGKDGVYHSKVLTGLWVKQHGFGNRLYPRCFGFMRQWQLI